MMKRLILTFIVFSLFSCGSTRAQRHFSKLYTTKDGLPTIYSSPLFFDSKGFLWIVSSEGFTLFDGKTFSTYNSSNGFNGSAGIIYETKNGVLYLGGRKGLTKAIRDSVFPKYFKFHQICDKNGFTVNKIYSIEKDKYENLFVTARNGVYFLHNDSLAAVEVGYSKSISAKLSLFNSDEKTIIQKLKFDNLGNVYAVYPDMVLKGTLKNHGNSRKIEFNEIILYYSVKKNPNHISDIYCDNSNRAWISTFDGSIIINDKYKAKQIVLNKEKEFSFTDFSVDPSGNLWFAAGKKIFSVSTSLKTETIKESNFRQFENLITDSYYYHTSIVCGNDNLWISAHPIGILLLKPKAFKSISAKEFKMSTITRFFRISENKYLILGPNLSILSFDKNGNYIIQTIKKEGIPFSANGAFKLNDEIFTYGNPPKILKIIGNRNNYETVEAAVNRTRIKPKNNYPVIFEYLTHLIDNNGTIWLSQNFFGFLKLNYANGEFIAENYLSIEHGLPDVGSRAILRRKDNSIWFGGYASGIGIYNRDTMNVFTTENGLSDNAIRVLFEDSKGRIWIGTSNGLNVFMGNSFFRFPSYELMPANAIWHINEDRFGNIWVGTETGLFKISFIDSYFSLPMVEFVSENIGLPAVPIYCILFADGKIICNSANDLFLIDETDYYTRERSSNIYFENVYIDGKKAKANRKQILSSNNETITINFSSSGKISSGQILYQYYVEGLNQNWSYPTASNEITISSLPPGKYNFYIKEFAPGNSFFIDNSHLKSYASIEIYKEGPIWSMWQFWLIALTVIFVVFFVIYRYRITNLLKYERMRSMIAINLHDDIGGSLTKISIYSDAALRELNKLASDAKNAEKIENFLRNIRGFSDELLESISNIVWTVNPKNDKFENILLKIKDYAARIMEPANIDYEINIDDSLNNLIFPIEHRRHCFLIFKEAISNIIKHSKADKVEINMANSGGKFILTIKDNGIGFDADELMTGNGLKNIRQRIDEIKGGLDLISSPGKGTIISIAFKLP